MVPYDSKRQVEVKPASSFLVVSPGVLDEFPASHITALAVLPGNDRFTPDMVGQLPNLTLVDSDQVLAQVRQTADQVSTVVEVAFWLSLSFAAWAGADARGERQPGRAPAGGRIIRVLGGSGWQLRLAHASEFAAIGLLAELVAAIAASILSGVIAVEEPIRPRFNRLKQDATAMACQVTLHAGAPDLSESVA